jgi:hypothetical protein
MTEKDLVQEALQQMKNLEDVVQENAKGILGATMAQEISELVKESLSKETKKTIKEQSEPSDDEDFEDVEDAEVEVDDMAPDMGDIAPIGGMDDMDDMEDMEDMEDDDMLDGTNLSAEELLSLYRKMDKDKDSFVIEKDGDNIHLQDDDNDVEYIIRMNEDMDEDLYEDMDEDLYEDMDEDLDESMDEDLDESMDEDLYEDMDEELDEEMDEVVYEITMDEDMDEELDESMDEDEDGDENEDADDEDDDESVNEAKYMIKPVMGKMKNKGEAKENKTMKSAMKGLKKSEAKEGNYMSKPMKPTKQTKVDGYKKETLPEKGISNVKKSETKEGKTITPTAKSKGVGMNLKPKKFEYKEAARTYGNGSKEGRGLRKGITNNRNYVYENEVLKQEIEVLKEKNEEYRKALNVFREKLNEVAVFNSNLAYATRLFTEHSTSKAEKINILRRFDDVESLKESKSLYTSIKNELSSDNNSKVVTESIERKIDKTASTGSATNLIESKTYENPQFLRMKDLMGKLQK